RSLFMFDAIIVGARCAGSPTGMLLARKGHSVLVVDKATFPSDTLSTHFITSEGVKSLAEWGLLERVMETGCPPIPEMQISWAGVSMPSLADPQFPGICPRRTVLDAILVDAARGAGAEVREAFSFDDLLVEDGVVVGIRGHNRGGEVVEERARIVVGADGSHSRVAEKAAAAEYNQFPSATCGYYSYWSDFEGPGMEVWVQDGFGIFSFKTHNGLTCAGIEWPKARFEEARKDIEGSMMATFEKIPGLGERARKAKRVDKYYGSGGEASYYRKPFGPGWALVGDSGYLKDPLMGQGITDAFRDANLVAAAIDAGLTGRQPMDGALATYETARNDATAMIYQITNLITGELKPAPEVVQMILVGMQAMAPAVSA
ncbi:MAG: NAD(P)/FAD-dependent oxidoreductase, partial [Tepidiformaceae bacterium]